MLSTPNYFYKTIGKSFETSLPQVDPFYLSPLKAVFRTKKIFSRLLILSNSLLNELLKRKVPNLCCFL